MSSQDSPAGEMDALMAALEEAPASTRTACVGWTAHHISAHLAAGTKEIADLIELKVYRQQQRPTLGFTEREEPFLELEDPELKRAIATEGERMQAAVAALADTTDPAFDFTGRSFTVAQLATHNRSEAALHRWDIVGDDDLSERLLTQEDLTRHAVDALNTLPLLYEAPRWRAKHADVTGSMRLVLRSPAAVDVVYEHTADGVAWFEFVEGATATGDALVSTDVANRYLSIWGRRSAHRPVTIDTDGVSPKLVESLLWGAGEPWDAGRPRS
jgi:Mycothiol maleylpyruvate isomerase N-terminal domain